MNEMSKRTLKAVPKDFSVRPLTTQAEISAASQPTQDGTCGLWWDDAIATYYTPAPAARCPFEAFHADEEEPEERTEAGPREILAGIREQADAATEGPWELLGDGEYVSGPGILVAPDDGGVTSADAEFIAAARTNVPWLLEQIERRDKALEAVRALHKPVEVEPSETICSGCSTLRGQGEAARYFPFTEYPCPTVAKVEAKLKGGA